MMRFSFTISHVPGKSLAVPEHFQRRMSDLLSGLDGVVCMIDDILVHGRTVEEHDDRLTKFYRDWKGLD